MDTVDVAPGAVIRVRDWPGVVGERFEVVDVVDGPPGSAYPRQVHAMTIERGNHGHRLGAFRAFPLDRCEVDIRATRSNTAVLEGVARRRGGA